MLRSPLEREEGERAGLELAAMDVQVGEGTPEFPRGRSQNPPATGSLRPSQALSWRPPLHPHCPIASVQPGLMDLSPGQPPQPARSPACLLSLASMVAGPACSLGRLPPGVMALMEGGRPPSCQSGGAPRSPSWLERGGWAGAGAGLSGPSQRQGQRGAA